jgi:4-hydroxy-4-methyl-2-oxoglutarate aldolase
LRDATVAQLRALAPPAPVKSNGPTRTDMSDEVVDFFKTHLYVAVVCDILDSMGYHRQAMHQRLRPLLPSYRECGFAGRARTIQWMDANYIVEADPYGLEIDVMDSLHSGDVVIHSTDNSGTNAPWGELMSTIAKSRGAVGCVCDSQIRDCVRIIEMKFPVYYAGIRPLDSKGRARVMAYDVPVMCGDVLVNPGELVFADYDGIVVIPKEAERDLVDRANEKVGKESLSRQALAAGKTLREVFDAYGVL